MSLPKLEIIEPEEKEVVEELPPALPLPPEALHRRGTLTFLEEAELRQGLESGGTSISDVGRSAAATTHWQPPPPEPVQQHWRLPSPRMHWSPPVQASSKSAAAVASSAAKPQQRVAAAARLTKQANRARCCWLAAPRSKSARNCCGLSQTDALLGA